MAYKQKRQIVKFGAASRGITLPKGWLEFYDLKEHDPLVVLGDSILIVARPEDVTQAEGVVKSLERIARAEVLKRWQ